MNILVGIFVIVLLIYELAICPSYSEKKIKEIVEERGGCNPIIDKISLRDKIYNVKYEIDGKPESILLKFDFFLKVIYL